MKYEIEFVSGDKEYEYEVDARTGEILDVRAESENEYEYDWDYEDVDDDDREDKHEDLYEGDLRELLSHFAGTGGFTGVNVKTLRNLCTYIPYSKEILSHNS